jgi:Iap family predicted aminopeptidase
MSDNPFLNIDRQIMGDIYTSPEMMETLSVLCDGYGSRFAGSAAEAEAAQFMKRKLEAYGLPNVTMEPVRYTGWRRGDATMRVSSPVERVIPCITLPHSPPADLEAELFDIGDGSPEDFAAHAADIAGKIVMTTSRVYPGGGKRWIHRNEKYGRALLAGAVGFIFVNHYPGFGPATGGIGPDDPQGGQALIPGLALSLEDGAYLRRLGKQGPVRLHLSSTDVCEPVTSWNVIAELPGTDPAAAVVMLGSHYDGHDIAQGAADPASGTVAVMEAARVLKQYAPDLPHTIRFALWGAEEIGLIGSTQYVDQHDAELDEMRFYLNMDMAGALDPKDIILNEWPSLAEVFEGYRDEMALEFGVGQSLSAHSDHFPFMLAGVPTGGIGSLKPTGDGRGYGHTKYDTLDKVEMRGLREAAALAARLALRMASAPQWPAARRGEDEVLAILDTPDYREERALFREVGQYYADHS